MALRCFEELYSKLAVANDLHSSWTEVGAAALVADAKHSRPFWLDPIAQIADHPQALESFRTQIWELLWCCAIHFSVCLGLFFQNRRGWSWRTVLAHLGSCRTCSAGEFQKSEKNSGAEVCCPPLRCVRMLPMLRIGNQQVLLFSTYFLLQMSRLLWANMLFRTIHIIDPIIAGSVTLVDDQNPISSWFSNPFPFYNINTPQAKPWFITGSILFWVPFLGVGFDSVNSSIFLEVAFRHRSMRLSKQRATLG